MAKASKALVKSTTFWGGLVAIFPLAAEVATQIAAVPLLPPHVAASVAAVGGTIAIVGRILARLPISGLFK
jgi:hypothetical protein